MIEEFVRDWLKSLFTGNVYAIVIGLACLMLGGTLTSIGSKLGGGPCTCTGEETCERCVGGGAETFDLNV